MSKVSQVRGVEDGPNEAEPLLNPSSGRSSRNNSGPSRVGEAKTYDAKLDRYAADSIDLSFDIDKAIADLYRDEQAKAGRECWKVLFSIATCGLGALYLWGSTMTIKEGDLCVRTTRDGRSIVLPPGRHSNFPGESYGLHQHINQEVIDLGPRKLVTIRDGHRGESYKNGKLVVLFPGRHLLDPTHTFVKSVSMDLDEVDLGPKKIVTIKNGYVGITYNKGVLQILKEGRHELNLPDERFSRTLSMQQEVVELPKLDIKTTDNIQVTCHAVLNYRIVDPYRAVTMVENLERSLYELAEVTLSSILRRMSFRDISPIPIPGEPAPSLVVADDGGRPRISKAKHMPTSLQAKMYDDFHQEFEDVVAQWGVEIIGGVQIKTIEPKDERLRAAIAEMAINTAKADALRRQAEFEREVRNTKAMAEKDALVLQAQGERESKLIRAEAEQKAAIIKAQGEAKALTVLSEARLEATKNDGMAAEALTTEVARQLALLGRQAEVLSQCKTPVYVPSEALGKLQVWSRDSATGTLSHFSNGQGGDGGSAALVPQMLASQALKDGEKQ